MREDGGDCMPPAAATAAALLPAGAPPSSGDVLWEIFVRLPPQPSSLVRVSFVCKRWRRLAADRDFLLRYRAQHRRKPPPLLGLFNEHGGWVTFTPLLDPPDRIPRHRFSMRIDYHGDTTDTHPYHGTLLGCRHGRLLVLDPRRRELLVCDPVTGDQRRVALPPEFRALGVAKGAVICADDERHHVHGGCHASPFKVVLVQVLCGGRACARVYSSSETGVWGGLILAPKQCRSACVYFYPPSTLVGNSLYWCSSSSSNVTMEILGFDVGTQSLSLIDGPRVQKVVDVVSWQIVRGDRDMAVSESPCCHTLACSCGIGKLISVAKLWRHGFSGRRFILSWCRI